jgi:AcrR family transcriptional regulator
MNERSFIGGGEPLDDTVTRGTQTRMEILQAAHQLFLERGYHGTSMREIARRAAISLSGIYNHFSSKEEIFLQVFLEQHPFYVVFPAMLEARGETVEEFVRDAARRMVERFDKRMDFLNLMFIELVEFNGQHVSQLFQMMFPQVMGFAERLMKGPESLHNIPLPIIVRAFIGLFFSYILTEIFLGRHMPPDMQTGALDHFVSIYLHGILLEKQ